MGEALVHLDKRKAFDKVDHHSLEAVLEAAGFSPEFCSWIKAIYGGIRFSVQVNGYLSEQFDIN